jgi:hypothetical protein
MPWQSGDRLFCFSLGRCAHQCRGSIADYAWLTRTEVAWPPTHTASKDCTSCFYQVYRMQQSHLILQFPTIAILYLCFLSIVSAR